MMHLTPNICIMHLATHKITALFREKLYICFRWENAELKYMNLACSLPIYHICFTLLAFSIW